MQNMALQQTLRVCVVNSTEIGFLNTIHFPKLITNDIVLVFDPRRDAVVQIGGFRTRLVGLPPQLTTPIGSSVLETILHDRLSSLQSTDQDGYIWLDEGEWTNTRSAIIQRNESLETIIVELENAQKKAFGQLNDDDAILFDAMRLVIETFDPKNKRDILAKLDSARELFAKAILPARFCWVLIAAGCLRGVCTIL